MLVNGLNSIEQRYPGLTIVPAIINTQNTMLRLVNETDTPVCLNSGTALANARNFNQNAITQFADFYEECQPNNDNESRVENECMENDLNNSMLSDVGPDGESQYNTVDTTPHCASCSCQPHGQIQNESPNTGAPGSHHAASVIDPIHGPHCTAAMNVTHQQAAMAHPHNQATIIDATPANSQQATIIDARTDNDHIPNRQDTTHNNTQPMPLKDANPNNRQQTTIEDANSINPGGYYCCTQTSKPTITSTVPTKKPTK